MFGSRKRIRELEAAVEDMGRVIRGLEKKCIDQDRKIEEIISACSNDIEALELRYDSLENREARHEMSTKERMDEYGTAIIANEEEIRILAAKIGRRTFSEMVAEHDNDDRASTARVLDEWLNGKKEGLNDE